MSSVMCPICRGSFEASLSISLPFCSERCRQVDLGRGFGEDYGFPREESSESEQEPEIN